MKYTKIFFFFIGGTLLLILMAWVMLWHEKKVESVVLDKECNLETRICPGGAVVGRSGPNCEFKSCFDLGMTEEPQSLSTERTGPSIEKFFQHTFDGRDLTLGKVLERQSTYTRYAITYRSGELTISGIMNVPVGVGPFPVLILNHGYIDPAIYTNGRGLRREQDYLARQGFIVLHSDYRNHAESSRVDDGELENRLGYVEDVINAVYAVRNSGLSYVDTEHIGMLGHSMGGGIAQTVAVAIPNLVKAVVLYAPVSMDYLDSYNKYMKNDTARAARIVGRYGDPSENNPVWKGISPKTYIDRWTVPVLLFQGTRDESVPKEWSDATAMLFEERGKAIEYVVYQGETHEFGFRWNDFMNQSTTFFQSYLLR